MLTEQEAISHILARITPLPHQRVPLAAALHGFAPRPIHALVPLPGFTNSAMDGYAVRAEDTTAMEPLNVTGSIPAGGTAKTRLEAHTTVRIFTGAPMPPGADAVIMQEDVSTLNGGAQIICNEPVQPGENVRLLGSDLCVGQRILTPGDRLTPARLAALASQGLSHTEIAANPRVGIVTTGDELMSPGRPLEPGRIFNSNATLLEGLIREQCPGAKVNTVHIPDDLPLTIETLRELTATQDFIILSGGVSVGEHDFVKPALQALRLRAEFWKVKVKPGKPFLFAKSEERERPCHVFGLPGNPVSSFVTFQLFVRPALLKALGASEAGQSPVRVSAVMASDLSNPGDRPHYIRGRHDAGRFEPLGMQQSHALFGLSQSDALLRMEPGQVLKAGDAALLLLCQR